MSKPIQIFLCHASEDKPKVIEVYRFLKQQGFKPWLDKEELLPGQRWDQEIPKALKASDFILIFFSQNSVAKRGYVQREFKLALNVLEEIPEGQIFVIPVRLDSCVIPERFHLLHYCDLFEDDGLEKVVCAIRASLQSDHQQPASSPATSIQITQPPTVQSWVLLRARAVDGFSVDAVKVMLNEKDFFDSLRHKKGKGLKHQYEAVVRNGEKLVIDHATGLIWQQGGTKRPITFAEKYVKKLNREQFAGFRDWRLPTLEEAMSLMEPEKKNGDLYIDPVFDKTQDWISTGDKSDTWGPAWGDTSEVSGWAWTVSFTYGYCHYDEILPLRYLPPSHYVRAVRSGQS